MATNASIQDTFLSCPPSFMDMSDIVFDELSLAIAMVAIPVGIVLAVCGCRLKRITFFLCGFITGMFITYAIIRDQIDTMQLPFEGAVGVAAAGGLVLGLLCLGVQVLGLFVVGMDAAFLIVTAAIGITAHFLTLEERLQRPVTDNSPIMFSSPFPSRWLPICTIIFACLLGGLVSLLRPRTLMMIGSSLIGTAVMILTFGYFLETKNPLRQARFIAASIIGTRYMQTHYGRYLFGYVPSSVGPESMAPVKQLRIANYFSISSLFGERTSTTTLALSTNVEKEESIPTFLCWSDFVLLACWLLLSSLFTALQSIGSNSRKRHLRRPSRVKIINNKSRTAPKATETVNKSSVRSSRVLSANQPSNNGLPMYSDASQASGHSVEAWYARHLDIFPTHAANQGTAGYHYINPKNGLTEESVNWMSRPNASSSSTSQGKNVQNSPVAGAGHLLRMRRSLGDVLSSEFISHCVAPRLPRPDPSTSQC